jgi:hypothetical protein
VAATEVAAVLVVHLQAVRKRAEAEVKDLIRALTKIMEPGTREATREDSLKR